jgi:hypothetical protein
VRPDQTTLGGTRDTLRVREVNGLWQLNDRYVRKMGDDLFTESLVLWPDGAEVAAATEEGHPVVQASSQGRR